MMHSATSTSAVGASTISVWTSNSRVRPFTQAPATSTNPGTAPDGRWTARVPAPPVPPLAILYACHANAGAMAPAFAWQAYKMASGGTGGAGTLAVHLPSGAVPGLVEVAGAWVNGRTRLFDVHTEMVDAPTALVLVALCIILVSTVALLGRRRSTSEVSLARQLALVSVTFLVFYVAFLWMTVGFLVYA